MKLSFVLLVALLFVSFAGCKKGEPVDTVNLEAQAFTNLKYGDDASQALDVYLPANRGSETKTIVFIHGGFWLGGDKAELTDLAIKFRDRGYATASINYRLTATAENNIHPAQVNDVASAINFIQSKANDWDIATGQVALLGTSAGGHIALLYTYAYNANGNVKTVISLAGPTNLAGMQNANAQQAQVLRFLLGADAQSSPAVYQQASPVTHVSASSKPTLLFHGKLDAVVPFQQSVSLKEKLDQFNVRNKLILYDNLGHDADLNAVPGFLPEVENWLTLYLK